MRKLKASPYILVLFLLLVSFQNCKKTDHENEVSLNNCIDVLREGYEIAIYQDVDDKTMHKFSVIKKQNQRSLASTHKPVFNWYFDDALVSEGSDGLERQISDCNPHWVRVELESCGQPIGIGREIKRSSCK